MSNVGKMVYDAVRASVQARDGGPGSGPKPGNHTGSAGSTKKQRRDYAEMDRQANEQMGKILKK